MKYLTTILPFLSKWISLIPFVGLFPNVLKIISSVFENVMPFIGQALQGLVWFLKTMWEGFKDVIDDVRTVLFVVVIALSASVYTSFIEKQECREEIIEIRKKLVPKNPVKTVPNNSQFTWPWEGLFK